MDRDNPQIQYIWTFMFVWVFCRIYTNKPLGVNNFWRERVFLAEVGKQKRVDRRQN